MYTNRSRRKLLERWGETRENGGERLVRIIKWLMYL